MGEGVSHLPFHDLNGKVKKTKTLTMAGTASDIVWLSCVCATALMHIARAVCIPAGHSHRQRQVSRLRPPTALQPTTQ